MFCKWLLTSGAKKGNVYWCQKLMLNIKIWRLASNFDIIDASTHDLQARPLNGVPFFKDLSKLWCECDQKTRAEDLLNKNTFFETFQVCVSLPYQWKSTWPRRRVWGWRWWGGGWWGRRWWRRWRHGWPPTGPAVKRRRKFRGPPQIGFLHQDESSFFQVSFHIFITNPPVDCFHQGHDLWEVWCIQPIFATLITLHWVWLNPDLTKMSWW